MAWYGSSFRAGLCWFLAHAMAASRPDIVQKPRKPCRRGLMVFGREPVFYRCFLEWSQHDSGTARVSHMETLPLEDSMIHYRSRKSWRKFGESSPSSNLGSREVDSCCSGRSQKVVKCSQSVGSRDSRKQSRWAVPSGRQHGSCCGTFKGLHRFCTDTSVQRTVPRLESHAAPV